MTMRRDLDSMFTSGSWNTYSLVEYSGPAFLSVAHITNAMKVFLKDYIVLVDVVPGPQLIFWTLTLKSKQEAPTTRSASRHRQPRQTITHVYKFAVSSDESLLFSSRLIPMKMQRQLSKSFSCNSLKLLKLTNSDPANLLLMYRQAKTRAPKHLMLQHEEHLASLVEQVHHCALTDSRDLIQEMNAAAGNKTLQTLGSSNEAIPCVRQLALSVADVPLPEQVDMPDNRFSRAEVDISSTSVFHLYKELSELRLVEDVPLWLQSVRRSGKTKVEAKYV